MYGHMNVKFITMYGHMNVKFITMYGHMNVKFITMYGHMNVKFKITVLYLEVSILFSEMRFCTIVPIHETLAGTYWVVCLLNHPITVNIIIATLHVTK